MHVTYNFISSLEYVVNAEGNKHGHLIHLPIDSRPIAEYTPEPFQATSHTVSKRTDQSSYSSLLYSWCECVHVTLTRL